ncbi:hypothetical protein J2Z29_001796 [Treponema pedis]
MSSGNFHTEYGMFMAGKRESGSGFKVGPYRPK